MNCDISVIIPLYNKEKEVAAAVNSVLAQTVLPKEIIVVDDGSTDAGAEIVRRMGSPLVRIVSQPNAGVSVARNTGITEASGQFVALLDADDTWEPRFLEKGCEMISRYPDCGIYATAFYIGRHGTKYPASSPVSGGILKDFFREATSTYICIPSSVMIPKKAIELVGGFPEGMKLGEDHYLWIKLAARFPVCFTPERLAVYNVTASNRSAGSYTPETTRHSFEELYRAGESNYWRNEFLARCAIGKALTLSAKGDTAFGKRTLGFFSYTATSRRALTKLRILNRLPKWIRPAVHNTYNRLGWIIARKGL